MKTEGSLPHSQVPANCPYPQPARSSPYPYILLPEDPSQYYLSIYACISQVVSFPQGSPPKSCIHLSSPPYALHVPPISFYYKTIIIWKWFFSPFSKLPSLAPEQRLVYLLLFLCVWSSPCYPLTVDILCSFSYWRITFCILFQIPPKLRGGSVGWGTALQARRSRVRFPTVSLGIFYWLNPSDRPVVPGVDSASNRNENQEYFLGVKGGRCVGLANFSENFGAFTWIALLGGLL